MRVEPNSEYFIVNAGKKIIGFYRTYNDAKKEANKLNDVFNNRPHNEFGYASGHHDFEVHEYIPNMDLSGYAFDVPNHYRAIQIGNQLFTNIEVAVNFYIRNHRLEPFEILVKYYEDEYWIFRGWLLWKCQN